MSHTDKVLSAEQSKNNIAQCHYYCILYNALSMKQQNSDCPKLIKFYQQSSPTTIKLKEGGSHIVKVLSVEQSKNNITHSASIPHRESFVSRAGDERVGVRQELNAVDGVGMAPQCAATPQTAQTNQQHCSGAFTSCLYFMSLLHVWCRKTHTYTNTHTLKHTHTRTPYTYTHTQMHTHLHTCTHTF